MDPNACLARWEMAVKRGDEGEAVSAWVDLRDWLRRGGFPPKWAPAMRRAFYGWAPATDGPWGDAMYIDAIEAH